MCERNRLCFASHEQAWVVLRYGANRDELWTSDKFIPHFDHAPKLASFKYPNPNPETFMRGCTVRQIAKDTAGTRGVKKFKKVL